MRFQLKINAEVRQNGVVREMIFNMDELVKYVGEHFPVERGDILLTGTPAGVGAISSGDRLEPEIIGELKTNWTVA